jgi:hypothetical protein
MIRQELSGWNVGVKKDVKPVKGENGDPDGVEEVWKMLLVERDTGNQIVFTLTREIRDFVVRELTGGVVLAGGDLPQV